MVESKKKNVTKRLNVAKLYQKGKTALQHINNDKKLQTKTLQRDDSCYFNHTNIQLMPAFKKG